MKKQYNHLTEPQRYEIQASSNRQYRIYLSVTFGIVQKGGFPA